MLELSVAGIDKESAFALLSHWLYLAPENRTRLSYRDAIGIIQNIGKFLHNRSNFYSEWYSTIVPLECELDKSVDLKALENEFYQGNAGRLEHILANLDILRHDKMSNIEAKFGENSVVIIRGASGQGKTILALRYLKEFYPVESCFTIRAIEGRRHALQIRLKHDWILQN